jgi:hypothetical protein
MRFRVPCLFHDHDIEQAPPLPDPHDSIGSISTLYGNTTINYLHVRVQLAYIQGMSFGLLWSAGARYISTEERKSRAARLQNMLSDWYTKIPTDFTPPSITRCLTGAALQHMVALFNTQLVCTIVIHGLHWEHNAILERIRTHVPRGALGANLEPSSGLAQQQTPLPAGWGQCVMESRACLRMAAAAKRPDYYTW